jgi:tRNA(fMet)-specific endonuclease VapC
MPVRKLMYLLDLPVIGELTRPSGNRRVFTLFAAHHPHCAIAASALYALARGIEAMHPGDRQRTLHQFVQELLLTGPQVLPFDREAALWLARHDARRAQSGRSAYTPMDGQMAAIAATQELTLVTRSIGLFADTGIRLEDWFRP